MNDTRRHTGSRWSRCNGSFNKAFVTSRITNFRLKRLFAAKITNNRPTVWKHITIYNTWKGIHGWRIVRIPLLLKLVPLSVTLCEDSAHAFTEFHINAMSDAGRRNTKPQEVLERSALMVSDLLCATQLCSCT